MNVTFSVAAFVEAAKAIRNARDTTSRNELLDCALVDIAGGSMAMTMSNLDLEIRAIVECRAEGSVRVAIPSAVLDFFAVRAGAGEAEGRLEFSDGLHSVTARHGRARMTIAILPADAFPVFDMRPPTWSFTMRGHEFCTMLATAVKAIPAETTRPYLCGVFLNVRDGEIHATATDGHRMHVASRSLPEGAEKMPGRSSGVPGVIIPDGAIGEMLKVFSGDESELSIAGTDARIVVEGAMIRMTSKLVDGTYPDYARLLVAPGPFRVGIEAPHLDQALASLAVVPRTDPKGRSMANRPVRFTAETDAILIEIRGDTGDADIRVPAIVEGSGEPFALNARLLKEAVAVAGGGRLTLAPSENDATALRLIPQLDDRAFVIMQLRW